MTLAGTPTTAGLSTTGFVSGRAITQRIWTKKLEELNHFAAIFGQEAAFAVAVVTNTMFFLRQIIAA
jgi:hypothetical protein